MFLQFLKVFTFFVQQVSSDNNAEKLFAKFQVRVYLCKGFAFENKMVQGREHKQFFFYLFWHTYIYIYMYKRRG